MKRPMRLWYGGPLGESLAVILPALPVGLAVGQASGHTLESLLTSLAISLTVYAFLKLDIAFIHPLFRALPPNRAVLMETLSGLAEHILGAWLAFSLCNLIFDRLFQGATAWLLAAGTVASVMIVHAITYTLHSHAEIKRQIAEEERLRAMATEAELKALKAQIDPHFLFNTLNTIAALIHSQPAQAEATVERLAGMFRYVLAGSERGAVPLNEELAFVDDYLTIEQARFGERLRISRDIAPGVLDVPVPSLILQPLVENAIQHGQRDDGSVDLALWVQPDGDQVAITIADQGPGLSGRQANEPPGSHGLPGGHGLRNVEERLVKTYGPAHGLVITANAPTGTRVTLRIPRGGES
jgi:signal transduction histidine kinase